MGCIYVIKSKYSRKCAGNLFPNILPCATVWAVKARDLEERQWEARHRPKSALMSMTSGGKTSRGRHHEAAGHSHQPGN